MDELRWERKPMLRRPMMVLAFEGWNDAGDAASLALACLASEWDAENVAVIDCEGFVDFTSTRPTVKLDETGRRVIEWPDTELLAASLADRGGRHDVVLVRGLEPTMRWRSYCALVVEVARALGVEMAVALGALLADVPHTRPVRVTGTSEDPELSQRLGLRPSSYEGPTGIVGVMGDSLRRAGVPCVSLWAAVPHYVHQLPSPKAALALVERATELVGVSVDVGPLRSATSEYEEQVSERVASDDDAAAYVAQLEEADDAERAGGNGGQAAFGTGSSREGGGTAGGLTLRSGDEIAAEIERFLREQRREG